MAVRFFTFLNRDRKRPEICSTLDEVRQDVFDYIEMFSNPRRRHGYTEKLSPIEFEGRHSLRLQRFRTMVAIHYRPAHPKGTNQIPQIDAPGTQRFVR